MIDIFPLPDIATQKFDNEIHTALKTRVCPQMHYQITLFGRISEPQAKFPRFHCSYLSHQTILSSFVLSELFCFHVPSIPGIEKHILAKLYEEKLDISV